MILIFIAVDRVNRSQWQVTDFDKSKLRTLAEHGVEFYALYADGHRERVGVEAVVPPGSTDVPEAISADSPTIEERLDAMSAMLSQLTTAVIEVNPKKKAALQAAALKINQFSTNTKEKSI